MNMKLWYALRGDGAVFSVNIERDADVEDLQDKIAATMSSPKYFVHPLSLVLYLARKDGAWLKGDSNVGDLSRGSVSTEYRKMCPMWRLDDEECFGKNFQPGANDIHVLVELAQEQLVNPQYYQLQNSLLIHILLDTETSTTAESNQFKMDLCSSYKCNLAKGKLRCMLLDSALQSELVVPTHLFSRRSTFFAQELLGFSDVDDVRNGLLVFEPLKQAFDHLQISFIYKNDDGYYLKVFDPSLSRQRLFGKLDIEQKSILLEGGTLPKKWKKRGQRFAPGTTYDLQTKFGDLDGRALCFCSLERPFKSCLNLHARVARKNAMKKKWMKPEEYDFEDFWPEGMLLAERMLQYEKMTIGIPPQTELALSADFQDDNNETEE